MNSCFSFNFILEFNNIKMVRLLDIITKRETSFIILQLSRNESRVYGFEKGKMFST